MNFEVLYKVALFWFAFYITPGPVWIATMEVTHNKNVAEIFQIFFKMFLPVTLTIEFSQAIICVIFIEYISKIFASVGDVFYLIGAIYILYLAFKVLKSKQQNTDFQLSFFNLVVIMLLSPKIWILFPAGAAIAVQMNDNLWINALVFGVLMIVISNVLFFLYVGIGKLGTKILKDNFAYLSFGLLVLFAILLLIEFFTSSL